MTSKTSKTMCAISAAAATAIFMMAGIARADDGGDGGELLPVVYVGGDEAGTASCAEQRELAKFVVEMRRTDGDVSPIAPAITCRDEIYAQTTVDAD